MLEKRCAKCREFKTLDQFHVSRRMPDGKQPYCKECNKAQVTARRNSTNSRPNRQSWPDKIVTYKGAHDRVRYERGRASLHQCVDCGEQAHDWSYTGGDPAQVFEIQRGSRLAYSLKPEFYVARCRKHHKQYDGALRKRFAG